MANLLFLTDFTLCPISKYIFWMIFSTTVASEPSFLRYSYTATVTDGDTLHLNCSERMITDFSPNSLYWTFNKTEQPRQHVVKVVGSDPSVKAKLNWGSEYQDCCLLSNEDGTLTINNISLYDMGTFTCSVRQRDFLMEVSWNIQVYVRPSPPTLTVDKTPLVEGTLGKLKCEVERATPDTVKISWIPKELTNMTTYEHHTHDNRNGTVQEISYLKAPFTRFSNGELIKCKAKFTNHDGYTSSERTKHRLNITYTYNTLVTTPRNMIEEGGSVTLTCTKSSDANPGKAELYRWLRDDVDLKLPNATGFLTYDSFSENQTGEYKCQIKSPAGWTRITHAKSTIVSIVHLVKPHMTTQGTKISVTETYSRQSSNSVTIIIAVLVVVGFFVVLGIAVFMCWRKRNTKGEKAQNNECEEPATTQMTDYGGYTSQTSQTPLMVSGRENFRSAGTVDRHDIPGDIPHDTYETMEDIPMGTHDYAQVQKKPGQKPGPSHALPPPNQNDIQEYAEVQKKNGPKSRSSHHDPSPTNQSDAPEYAEVQKKNGPKPGPSHHAPPTEYAEVQKKNGPKPAPTHHAPLPPNQSDAPEYAEVQKKNGPKYPNVSSPGTASQSPFAEYAEIQSNKAPNTQPGPSHQNDTPEYAEVQKKNGPKYANMDVSNNNNAKQPDAVYDEVQQKTTEPKDSQVIYAELDLPNASQDGKILGEKSSVHYAYVGPNTTTPDEGHYYNT